MTRRLAEEHDMRRLEQMEMQQRFDNNEKAGKTDIQELFNKMRKEQVLILKIFSIIWSFFVIGKVLQNNNEYIITIIGK